MQDSRWSRTKKEERGRSVKTRKRGTRQRRGCRCRILREGERKGRAWLLVAGCCKGKKKKQLRYRTEEELDGAGVTVFERLDSDKRRLGRWGARTGYLEGGPAAGEAALPSAKCACDGR